MRIAVDLRILVVGEGWINRGMGRFTQQQLAAVLAIDHDNDYIVLCDRSADLSLLASEISAAENAYVMLPPAWDDGHAVGQGSILRRGEEFQDWLYRLDVGLYHAATPCLLWEPVLAQFDACPVVATLYDLIPLVYPSRYLDGGDHDGPYFRALQLVGRADRVLAISESAKNDARIYLGISPRRIDIAYPAADEVFRPWAPDLARAILSRHGLLPERFVLAVSAFHHSKNLVMLLEGYAALPPAVRVRLPLLLGGHFGDTDKALMAKIAARLGILDDVVMVGVVTDEELAALYNCATVVVHPSRYEGFGYPVLEAMSCGAPVITTTASSLPEVGGDAVVLVDPDDPAGLASAIRDVQSDAELRLRMSQRGLERAASFSLPALGAATLACYQKAVRGTGSEPSPIRASSTLRVAMWTPLPPLQSGVADYAVELLHQLKHTFDIEVFVDDGYLPEPDLLEKFRVYNARAFARRHSQQPFDVTIYQMGNSKFHWYIYEQLKLDPGIVVLHDLSASPVLFDRCYSLGDFEPFMRELAAVEGEAARREFAETFPRLGARERDLFSAGFLKRHPMLHGIISRSHAQVVHTDPARLQLLRRCPDAKVSVVGMGVASPPLGPNRVLEWDARRVLGYQPGTFVVSSFGIVHETKRLEQCIRALPALLEEAPDALLVLVGRTLAPGYADALLDVARQAGVAGHLRFRGHLSRDEFDRELLACDAVVNLRTPSASHMSATLMRALGAGRPVVMTDLADWASIPDDACLRVPAGRSELGVLAGHLRALAREPELRARLSGAARSWFLEHGTLTSMAEGYREVVRRVVMERRIATEQGGVPALVAAAAGMPA